MELSKTWYNRIYNDPLHTQFLSKWLVDEQKMDVSMPVLAITNGWMSEHHKNQYYSDGLDHGINVLAYDSRGTGESPKEGRLNAVQMAIDANAVISKAFNQYDRRAAEDGKEPGNKIFQGNCQGTMAVSALFAGKLPLKDKIAGTVLISPVSTFNLPWMIKATYFLPSWFAKFAKEVMAPFVIEKIAPGMDSELSRNEALARVEKLIPDVAVRQVREIFWKENVKNYWKEIDVPSLILVSRNDPLVKYEHSIEPYENLKYPIWWELKAADHLVLESNLDLLGKILPEFSNDPWGFYDKYQHLEP